MVDVCLLTETYHPVTGGGETQARVLANGFSKAGIFVTVITRRSDRTFPAHEKIGAIEVWRLGPKGPGQFKKWGLVISAFIKLIRLRKSYDAILVCGYRILGIPAVCAAKLLGKACVLKADSLGELSGEFFRAGLERLGLTETNFLFRFLLARRNTLLRRASCFVAISSAVEKELIDLGVPDDRIVYIPNSVDTKLFTPVEEFAKVPLRLALHVPVTARIGVFTGRLVSTKGLPSLVSVWAKVTNDHPEAHLILVGSGGIGIQNCEAELRELVERSGLEKAVTFTGAVANVHEYLQAADFFVFPTQREAFGISVIEAMASGLPVITVATGGVADIVVADETAIVIPVADEKALENAIDRVLRSGADLQRMADAGRETVVARYSEKRVLRDYTALLQRLAP